ncbi:Sugar kinase of the NBD/HSP70 family, may contain an N-terminal HTH domain [Palleronia marisminoris]|uniref:N-acetylglucosamine repressor n=1 Tax=Palleronia marisminoris TaxID=315423 RepID=A0A1Y5R7Y7_9RHOB|nr:ROK family transcriptional regulator [Palleronia marisminoris]SFG07449.1 Sugar kinase of the NBD/HSP70 family, may contain an N-terminal HTH domain [Palleronia marisminoris]SLN11186.1 N-acetylglucosamine repressor [Palleronia marisminoris]
MEVNIGGPSVATCGPVITEDPAAVRPLKLRIFDFIRASGPVPRARVARVLNISPGTVSTLTGELIETGLLQEVTDPRKPPVTPRGRPPVSLAVRPDAFVVVGIKLSSRDRTGILVDFAGNRLASVQDDVAPVLLTAAAQIDAIGAMVTELLRKAGRSHSDLGGVGLGVPGFVHNATGHVHWSPVFAERGFELSRLAAARLGVPVAVDNDANLVALAELWFGLGRDKPDFAVVTIEQGVGFGVVLNHNIFRGANGYGVELGHTKVQVDGALCRCGQHGCLEAYLADYAIARDAAVALKLPEAQIPPILELIDMLRAAADAGDETAASVYRRARRYLAAGLSTVVNLFNPTLLILSGGRMRYDWLNADDLLNEMREFTIDAGEALPPLEIHEWGDLMWAHGAAALALSNVTETQLGLSREAVA